MTARVRLAVRAGTTRKRHIKKIAAAGEMVHPRAI
jgi:hypothetical protein